MTSLILQTATYILNPLLLVFSAILLLRGHNEPGGGFVAGLVAAIAFTLYAITYDATAARRALRIEPRSLIGGGLLVAIASGLPALYRGEPFFTGQWTQFTLPGSFRLDFGTPLLFDLGVYLVVVGVTLTIIMSLSEE